MRHDPRERPLERAARAVEIVTRRQSDGRRRGLRRRSISQLRTGGSNNVAGSSA